jgi:hypothetical protein
LLGQQPKAPRRRVRIRGTGNRPDSAGHGLPGIADIYILFFPTHGFSPQKFFKERFLRRYGTTTKRFWSEFMTIFSKSSERAFLKSKPTDPLR